MVLLNFATDGLQKVGRHVVAESEDRGLIRPLLARLAGRALGLLRPGVAWLVARRVAVRLVAPAPRLGRLRLGTLGALWALCALGAAFAATAALAASAALASAALAALRI